MAEAAKILQFEQTPILELVEAQPRFIDADSVEQLGFVRRRAHLVAEDILSDNYNLLMEGEFDSVPIAVDALGTGRKFIEAERIFGENSEQANQLWSGLLHDCIRLFGEAYRKNAGEYFPKSQQEYDSTNGEYYSHGQSVRSIVVGGLSPVAEPGEIPLRIDDFVEEITYEAIGAMPLDSSVSVLTVLECPQWALDAYEQNPEGAFYGYVPSINKLMLRGMEFYSESGIREEEQLALPGLFITHEVIMAVLEETGRIEVGTKLTNTELHGKQFIDQEAGEVLKFAQLLDQKASEMSSKNIFMGEEVAADHPKDYQAIKAESEERRKKLHHNSRKLAYYVIDLVDANTDRWAADALVSDFVDKELKKIVRHNPDLAEIVYDKKTADGYREVARLEADGHHIQAARRLKEVEEAAPEISYCGAGSCGLARVNSMSPQAQKARELGLVGEQLHDTERPCPNCGEYTVHYDNRGSKVCTSCEDTEIKK